MELNEYDNTIYQNLSDLAKAVLRGSFIASNAYIKKEEIPKLNNRSFHLRKLEKEEQIKSKVSRIKERIRFWTEINEIENRFQ